MMKWLEVTVICVTLCGVCSSMATSEIEDFKNFLEETSQLDQLFVKKGANPDNDQDEEDAVSDDAWEQSGKFEGDLILNDRQRRVIVQDVVEGLSRNGLRDTTKRWPDNEVIYYIQREHFSSDQVQAIEDGINDLAQASCVKFRPYRRGDRDAVVIQGSRRGCFSQVGYQGGYQVLNLNARHPPGRGCFRHGTVVHEMLHTLGFYHMQSSPDRDDYIDVKWENIHQPARHNFRKYNTFSVSDFGVGYDYDSVLHYSRRAFSINGQDTLVPKQSGASIGQRIGLSDKDAQKLNRMYCDANADSQKAVAADEPIQKKEHKNKKPKNKPFEGHGIGYHQGKTIVIKLPTIETLNLPKTPIFHMFDRFSKTPQAVSTKVIEGFGVGQEIGDQYKQYYLEKDNSGTAISHMDDKKEKKEKKQYDGNPKENDNIPVEKENDHSNEDPSKTTAKDSTKNESPRMFNVYDTSHEIVEKKNSEDVSDVVNEAFDRLGKIIRTHVYPSQKPDLKIFKDTPDYSKFYTPKEKNNSELVIAKLGKTFGSTIFTNEKKSDKKDKLQSTTTPDDDVDYNAYNKFNREEKENTVGLSESPSDEDSSKEFEKTVELSIELAESPSDEDSSKEFEKAVELSSKPQKYDERTKDFDVFYGTSDPLKEPAVANDDKLVTPAAYLKLKNLSDKHDYSGLYHAKKKSKKQKDKHALYGYLLPVHNDWLDSDDIKKDNEKYDREAYSYPSNSKREHVVLSKLIQYEPDRPNAKEMFGRLPSGKAYSLFGVLVPLTQKWYRIDYDPHDHVYSLDKTESSEDYR